MTLHPSILAAITAIREDGMVSWRSDLRACVGLQKVKPAERADVFVSAVLALCMPATHDLPNTDPLVGVLQTLMTVKANRSWKRVTLTTEHVANLLQALRGDPELPRWLLLRLRDSLVLARDQGIELHPFFLPYLQDRATDEGAYWIRRQRPRFPHPDGDLPPGENDALQQLAEEIDGLERAQHAHPQRNNRVGWRANKSQAVALRDWFAQGPAVRATQRGVVGLETWGWWRVRTFQLKLWGTTLMPDLELWFATLDSSAEWPPESPRSRAAPSPSGTERPHITLPLFALMGPEHGRFPAWSTQTPDAFLNGWWATRVQPWMSLMTTLHPLLDDAPGRVPVTRLVSEAAVQAAIARQ